MDVLEIGVGIGGADHLEWARKCPRRLAGVDLTPRAVTWTSQRLAALWAYFQLQEADAEHLPFPNDSFDIIYSWGVLITRLTRLGLFVKRPSSPAGRRLRAMIYHRPSFVGLMLWFRYGLAERLGDCVR